MAVVAPVSQLQMSYVLSPPNIAAAASALAVLVAVVFGSLTIHQWRRTRHLTAAAELVRTIQTPEFTRAIARLMELPVDASAEQVAEDEETVAAFHVATHVFESLGVLVFHRLLPLHLVDDLLGGYVRASWRRVRPFAEARRAVLGANSGEWFEWLADRMEEHPAPGKSRGAYHAHRGWRP
jgi:hypothetical protein